MNRLGKFMLKLVGMYIPFVAVILGIGACSYIYKDDLLGRAKVGAGWDRTEEEIVPDEPELPASEGDVGEPSTDVEPIGEPTESTDNSNNDESDFENLPAIGECVCPETDGSK
jgi:hypothetical protein